MNFIANIFNNAGAPAAAPAVAGPGFGGWPAALTQAITQLNNVHTTKHTLGGTANITAAVNNAHTPFRAAGQTHTVWNVLINQTAWADIMNLLELVEFNLPLSANDAHNILIQASIANQSNVVERILTNAYTQNIAREVVNRKDLVQQRTPLGWACVGNYQPLARTLLRNGARGYLSEKAYGRGWIQHAQLQKYHAIEKKWRDQIGAFEQAGGLKTILTVAVVMQIIRPGSIAWLANNLAAPVFSLLSTTFGGLIYGVAALAIASGIAAWEAGCYVVSKLTNFGDVLAELTVQAIAATACFFTQPWTIVRPVFGFVRDMLPSVNRNNLQYAFLVGALVITSSESYSGPVDTIRQLAGVGLAGVALSAQYIRYWLPIAIAGVVRARIG